MDKKNLKYKLYNWKNLIIISDCTNDNDKVLIIIKENSKIFEKNYKEIKNIIKIRSFIEFEFIIGIIQVEKLNYLVLLKSSKPLKNILNNTIFFVENINLININIIKYEDQNNFEQSHKTIKKIKKYLLKGFYFSYFYKLYKPIKDQISNLNLYKNQDLNLKNNDENDKKFMDFIDLSLISDINSNDINKNIDYSEVKNNFFQEFENLEKEDNFKFIWNLNILNHFKLKNINKKWFICIIQGYIDITENYLDMFKKKIKYISIFRRSYKLGGTRFNNRGIDINGYCSNFVETENIINYDDFIYSILSVRGSVPLFWKQAKVTSEIDFYNSNDDNFNSWNKHINNLKQNSKSIILINLLKSKNTEENKLINNYKKYVEEINDKNTIILHFDYHHSNKNNTLYHDLKKFCIKLFKLSNKNYYSIIYNNKNQYKWLIEQNILFRINCLDSLDRTNFFQMMVSIYFYSQILGNIFNKFNRIENFSDFFDSLNININKNINWEEGYKTEKLKNIWNLKENYINGGNIISYFYTGTFSSISSQIKNNKNNILNIFNQKIIGIQRYYANNFKDLNKQKIVNIIWNKTKKINIIAAPSSFLVISYNFKDNKNNNIHFDDIFEILKTKFIDNNIILFVYQKSKNNNFNLIKNNKIIILDNITNIFNSCIREFNINNNSNISLLYSENSNSNGIVALGIHSNIKFTLIQNMKKYSTFLDNFKIYNYIFEINNTKFSLVNFYFKTNVKIKEKFMKILNILKKINKWKDNFIYILTGYLNIKLKSDLKQSKITINNDNSFEQLKQYDQLIFNNYYKMNIIEGDLKFKPIISPKANRYQLIRSMIKWGDRILFYYNKNYNKYSENLINIEEYDTIESFHGNHKPIYCKFNIQIN